jgi:hypothetical protein
MPLAGSYSLPTVQNVTADATPAAISLTGLISGVGFFCVGIYNPGPEIVRLVQGSPANPERSGLVVLPEQAAQFGPFREAEGLKLYADASQVVDVSLIQVLQ